MNQSISFQNHQINIYSEGQGEIILFLHGWPTNSRLWSPQIASLKANYKVVSLDWLGFGKSDKPDAHSYTFTQKKEILNTVIATIIDKSEKINIIAHDVGGPPAIMWAHENQERIQRLVLLNTIIYPFSTSLDKTSHFFFGIPLISSFLVSRFGLETLMKTLTKNKSEETRSRIKQILGWHEKLTSRIKLKTILEPLKAGKKREFLSLANKFEQLKLNKYLVIAKADPLCYQHMKKLKESNPDTPSFIIDKCGHYIPLDRPDELNKILISLLKDESH